jgi:hypothetical protein
MAIKSRPFCGTHLSGADARAFARQVSEGPTPEALEASRLSVERGRAMLDQLADTRAGIPDLSRPPASTVFRLVRTAAKLGVR